MTTQRQGSHLEIEAEASAGFPEKVVRTVTENSRTLKFTQQGSRGLRARCAITSQV